MNPSRSLRWRLLAATLAAIGVALVLAWFALGRLFADHVQRQFQAELAQQLDQLTARLDFTPGAPPRIDPASLPDPRWQRPLSGLYWQLDALAADGRAQPALARSRSLWDAQLTLPADAPADGQVHVHTVPGPQDKPLLVLERSVRAQGAEGEAAWRLAVAGDLAPAQAAAVEFSRMLGVSLAVLGALLAAAAWAQVAVGLRPLRDLQRSLRELQSGRTTRLGGRFPAEVQPLVDGFNTVLDRNQEMVEQARVQAGNLAHALKTPLAVLDQLAGRGDAGASPSAAGAAASHVGEPDWAPQVRAQVLAARRQVDWHLARARMAAGRQPGQRCAVAPVLQGLLRTLPRLHADRGLAWDSELPPVLPDFAGQAPDLQEMLGNLLDNAGKWARTRVRVAARVAGDDPAQLEITVEDDGPGIAADRLAEVVNRGVRLDESVPGSGLGLAIVQDGARLHGGRLALEASARLGGLRAVLRLPAAPRMTEPQAR